MTTHNLHDERPLMRQGRGFDGVHSLNDPVEGRVRPNGHVRPTEVVVNGSHHPHNIQMTTGHRCLLVDLRRILQLLHQTGPFLSESVCSCKRTISSNDHEVGDSFVNQVLCSFESSRSFSEVQTSCRSN